MNLAADFATERGPALIATMAKHFGHKIPTSCEGDVARLEFEGAPAELIASPEGLRMTVRGKDEETARRIAGVVESHLLRFAFREDPAPLVWSEQG